MGKQYCCVVDCHNTSGTVIDGKPVKLHRFPVNGKLRRIWISRVSRRNWKTSSCTRICSVHFEGKNGPTKEAPLPTIFPHKVYALCQITDTSSLASNKENSNPEELHLIQGTANTDICKRSPPNNFKAGEMSATEISVHLHDYENVFDGIVISPKRNITTQTKPYPEGSSTQTYSCGVTTTKTVETQTPGAVRSSKDVSVQVCLPYLTADDLSTSEDFSQFTGLPNKVAFDLLYDQVKDAKETESKPGRKRKMRLVDELFMVLMRLRLGLLIVDLSQRFCISRASCCRIINEWIDFLHKFLSPLLMWPSREAVRSNMPEMFKRKYPNCRIIIDCTEILTETPQSLANQSLMFSDYKSHMTWKFLLGISPAGVITFVSELWTGSISDKQITKACGLLDKLEAGDAVMADKGFVIADMLTPRGIHLIIPPRRTAKTKMTRLQVEQIRRIANLRIHVERAVERVKNYRIIQGVTPITMAQQVSKIVYVICALSNLQQPLINENS